MTEQPLPELKEKCAAAYRAFLLAAERTQELVAAVALPIDRDFRGSLLQQLMVEHDAHDKYRAARQEVFQFVQKHFRE